MTYNSNNENASQGMLIGRDIPWEEIEDHDFQVKSFLPLTPTEQGKVKAHSTFMPYAMLTVYKLSGKFKNMDVLLPVLHKVDFSHLWELYQERGVKSKEEVIVYYAPQKSGWRKLFGKTFPHLRIEVRPKGSSKKVVKIMSMPVPSGKEGEELLESIRLVAEWDPIEGRIK